MQRQQNLACAPVYSMPANNRASKLLLRGGVLPKALEVCRTQQRQNQQQVPLRPVRLYLSPIPYLPAPGVRLRDRSLQ